MTVIEHDFASSLAKSNEQADAAWWFDVYKRAFPTMKSAVGVRDDGWAQRGGIDRVITLGCGLTITVDEKVRDKDWPDILLERWSDERRKIPGWIQKPLACNYIAYAFVPSQTCYLLPTGTLQRAWKMYGRKWVESYGDIRAQNRGYVTLSVPVPIRVLLDAMCNAMKIEWGGT